MDFIGIFIGIETKRPESNLVKCSHFFYLCQLVMEPKKFIDIDKVLKEKAAKLYRWLPRFAINWLKKKLHENDINTIMASIGHVHGLEFNAQGLEKLGAKAESVNAHFIPRTGKVTIASNHPLGGLDGMALIKEVGEVRPDVKFLVNDVLKSIKNYDSIYVAVNKLGSASAKSLRIMEEVFRTDNALLIFPSGLVSRKQNGLIRDLKWRKSFVTQAIDHQRLIQPVFIEGENSKFFYNFAKWRKRLGIKVNIEMLFLPDEMFRANKKTIKVHFSKPFDAKLLDSSKTHREWSELIYKFIYSPEFMKGVPFEEYMKQ